MRFACLGSGSRGNAWVVACGATRVLVDCGFGPRETARRLSRLGLAPDDLRAILVTHEHSDHVGGASACARRWNLPLHMTHGTRAAAALDVPVVEIDSRGAFALGDLLVQPFPVPHDAREPVQFVFSDGAARLAIVTDLGYSTAHVEAVLGGCDALVLECNHDARMLAEGRYPPVLKQRIAGRYGHLENAAAGALVAALDRSRLQHLVAAHLSEQNNSVALARAALAAAAHCAPEWIGVAHQDAGLAWREVR